MVIKSCNVLFILLVYAIYMYTTVAVQFDIFMYNVADIFVQGHMPLM